MADSFVFYRSFYEAIKDETDDVIASCVKALCTYALDDEEPELDASTRIFFRLVKAQIDANNRKRESGRKGGTKNKHDEASESKHEASESNAEANASNDEASESKHEANVNANANANVNANANENVNANVNANEKGKDSKEKSAAVAADPLRPSNTDYQAIVDAYNRTCVSFPSVKFLSDSRKKAIHARLKTYSLGDFQTMFEKAEKSDFLKGANDRNWSATFDWMLKDANFAKILDGNYDNGRARSSPRGQPKSRKEELEEMYRMTEEWANS
jgi:hypothetical protein